MPYELYLTPGGQLRCMVLAEENQESTLSLVAHAFYDHVAQGLVVLASQAFPQGLGPDFVYWREFACRYMTERCHTPEGVEKKLEPVAMLTPAEAGELLLSMPPMRGAEYATAEIFLQIWKSLDGWVIEQTEGHHQGFPGFLETTRRAGGRSGVSVFIWRRIRKTRNCLSRFWLPTLPK